MLKDKFPGSREDIYCVNLWHFQKFMQEGRTRARTRAPRCKHSLEGPWLGTLGLDHTAQGTRVSAAWSWGPGVTWSGPFPAGYSPCNHVD